MRVEELRVRWVEHNELKALDLYFPSTGELGSLEPQTVPMSDRLRHEIEKLDRLEVMLIIETEGTRFCTFAPGAWNQPKKVKSPLTN